MIEVEVCHGSTIIRFVGSGGKDGGVEEVAVWSELVERVFTGNEGDLCFSGNGRGVGVSRVVSTGEEFRSLLASAGDGERVRKFEGSVGDGETRRGVERAPTEVEARVARNVVEGFGGAGVKKKKMGKNQKDRVKARLAASVESSDWRKPVVEKVGKVEIVAPVVVEKSEARLSLEEKWVVENRVSIAKAKLAEEKAKKDLEFQCARDVDAEVRKSRARIMRETESSKVATEKAFASLKASGNVPGFCATVVSDGPGLTDGSSPECTISPDSSASMHEFRAAQKEVLDLKKEVKDLTRQLRLGKLMLGEEVTFTAKSDGDASEELTKALDELENECFYVDRSEDPACFGVNKTIYAKRMYIDTHSYDGDY